MTRVMRFSLRRHSILALCLCLRALASSPLAAQSGGEAAALSRLARDEAALPASPKPAAGLAPELRREGARAFFAAGVDCHDLMRDSALPLSKKAFAYLESSLAYEESPLARAYLGSAHLIAARDAKSVIAKVREVDSGLKELDAAVKAAPGEVGVRAVRIESTIELPAMFKRLDAVTADLELLLKLYLKDKDALSAGYDPARLFLMKAREQELRGKNDAAAKYRQKAAELGAAGGAAKERS
jgi:hypothetical protein